MLLHYFARQVIDREALVNLEVIHELAEVALASVSLVGNTEAMSLLVNEVPKVDHRHMAVLPFLQATESVRLPTAVVALEFCQRNRVIIWAGKMVPLHLHVAFKAILQPRANLLFDNVVWVLYNHAAVANRGNS